MDLSILAIPESWKSWFGQWEGVWTRAAGWRGFEKKAVIREWTERGWTNGTKNSPTQPAGLMIRRRGCIVSGGVWLRRIASEFGWSAEGALSDLDFISVWNCYVTVCNRFSCYRKLYDICLYDESYHAVMLKIEAYPFFWGRISFYTILRPFSLKKPCGIRVAKKYDFFWNHWHGVCRECM